MKKSTLDKRWAFIINITYFAIIAGLIFVFFKYAVIWMLPFIIGFALAAIANPIVSRICEKTKTNRKFCAFVVMLLEYIILIFLFWYIGTKIITSAQTVLVNLPRYFDETIAPLWDNLHNNITNMTKTWPPEILSQFSAVADGAFESLKGLMTGISESFLSGVAHATSQVPFLFISIVFSVLSSFLICMDYDKIKLFVRKLLPHRISEIVSDTKLQLGKTLLKYFKAYSIIMCMTFLELLIGLAILRVENALGIAAIIAVFDILPVLGTGGIMIPWSIFAFASGNYFMGTGLLILYLVVLIVRNFAEPKIIGMQLGLHPLVTLVTIYIGYKILGFVGMIALPVSVTILLELHRNGKFKLWPSEFTAEENSNYDDSLTKENSNFDNAETADDTPENAIEPSSEKTSAES